MDYIPLITSITSFIFAITVLDQYFARRKPYQLLWAIGLFMYCVSTFTEFWTGVFGLNEIMYRLWYLFGAIYVADYLGMGTLYLLVRRKIAHIIMAALGLVSLYAALRVFMVNLDLSALTRLSGNAMPGYIRMMTPLFNSFGTLALVGGAVYSAFIFWRKRILPHRVVSNILIAVGAILPAFGGLHIRIGGGLNLFFIFELLGVIIMFIGFLRTKEVFGLYRSPLIHGFKKVEKPE